MERDSSARDSKRASSTASGASMHSEVLSQELQKLSDIKMRLEEENNALRRKVLELEDSNNTLRKQLVDARRFSIYMFHCSLLTYSLYIFSLQDAVIRELLVLSVISLMTVENFAGMDSWAPIGAASKRMTTKMPR